MWSGNGFYIQFSRQLGLESFTMAAKSWINFFNFIFNDFGPKGNFVQVIYCDQ
jgi:hypothetical protein